MQPDPDEREWVARVFRVLGARHALDVLGALSHPKSIRDIVIPRSGSERGEPLSVQAIYEKKDMLAEVGLVLEVGQSEGGAATFAVDRRAIQSLISALRRSSRIDAPDDAEPTLGAQFEVRPIPQSSGPRTGPSGPALVCVDGVAIWSMYPLAAAGKEAEFGRTAENRIPWDPTLSGRHFTIKTEDVGWTVRDEGSRNGTFLDGRRLPDGTGISLRPGQLLTAGLNTFVIHPGA